MRANRKRVRSRWRHRAKQTLAAGLRDCAEAQTVAMNANDQRMVRRSCAEAVPDCPSQQPIVDNVNLPA
jgi:hypothetical protein